MCPPHCIDLFSSFKSYMVEHNMHDVVQKTKHNLDEKSCECVDLFLKHVMLLPDCSKSCDFLLSRNLVESLYTAEELEVKKEYENLLPELKKDFNLLGNKMLVESFCFHNGLRFCTGKMKTYIQGKDFIDGGAWIGDSVLVFNKYNCPKKVYSFEISERLVDQYVNVMKINNVPDDKYEIVPCGLSDKRGAATFFDSADTGTSLLNPGENNAQVISVDEFVRNRDLKIGFLKIDVVGSGYEALKGSAETIKRDRPIICLAVYHSPHEFFDSKFLLDEITKNLNYKIEYKNMQYRAYIAVEFVIFAYPAELVS